MLVFFVIVISRNDVQKFHRKKIPFVICYLYVCYICYILYVIILYYIILLFPSYFQSFYSLFLFLSLLLLLLLFMTADCGISFIFIFVSAFRMSSPKCCSASQTINTSKSNMYLLIIYLYLLLILILSVVLLKCLRCIFYTKQGFSFKFVFLVFTPISWDRNSCKLYSFFSPAEMQFYSSLCSMVIQIPVGMMMVDFAYVSDTMTLKMFVSYLFNGLCFHGQTITAYGLMRYISPVTHR